MLNSLHPFIVFRISLFFNQESANKPRAEKRPSIESLPPSITRWHLKGAGSIRPSPLHLEAERKPRHPCDIQRNTHNRWHKIPLQTRALASAMVRTRHHDARGARRARAERARTRVRRAARGSPRANIDTSQIPRPTQRPRR